MDKLKQEVRKLVKRHMSLKGHALLAEGKRRRHSSRKMSGHALLAEGKRRRHSSRKASGRKVSHHSTRRHSVRHMSGKAMLAEGKHKRGAPRGNHSALLEINKIARHLKQKHPHLEHREAISKASAEYRKMNGSARHSTKRYSRHY